MHIGYVRVSTNEQNTALQRDALERSGCELIFEDKMSGKTSDRPGLKKLLKTLSSGDTLVVWKLDRLGRSMRHLVILVEELRQRNVQLGEAAKRDVGSGAGQVPDMSSFQSGGGWFKLPSGYVIQAFEASFDSNGLYINFPIPFPSSVIAIVPGVLISTTASPSLQFPSIQRDANDLTRFFAKYNMGGMNSSYFIAIGK
ncbi:TPA: recombinase family protein [Enterobacter hormaechei]|nr:recombinase family protein [Enterobacter hormaechei]HAS1833671.1 recombinase family protein [Enterobacter hormaechei subsp. xiangfangensis]